MDSIYNFHSYKNTKLHYKKSGNGKNILFAFHGFGQDINYYQKLEKQLWCKYTIYFFDLFHHGKSTWANPPFFLEKLYWKELMQDFLKKENIEKFSLMGYSLGGLLVLTTLEVFENQVEKIYLIATDGLHTFSLYHLVMYSKWTRSIFYYTLFLSKPFEFLASILQKTGLLQKDDVKFVVNQINSKEKQLKLYNTWVLYSKLQLNIANIAQVIRKYEIKVIAFAGKYDNIVPIKTMQSFLSQFDVYQLEILDVAHPQMLHATADFFEKLK